MINSLCLVETNGSPWPKVAVWVVFNRREAKYVAAVFVPSFKCQLLFVHTKAKWLDGGMKSVAY